MRAQQHRQRCRQQQGGGRAGHGGRRRGAVPWATCGVRAAAAGPGLEPRAAWPASRRTLPCPGAGCARRGRASRLCSGRGPGAGRGACPRLLLPAPRLRAEAEWCGRGAGAARRPLPTRKCPRVVGSGPPLRAPTLAARQLQREQHGTARGSSSAAMGRLCGSGGSTSGAAERPRAPRAPRPPTLPHHAGEAVSVCMCQGIACSSRHQRAARRGCLKERQRGAPTGVAGGRGAPPPTDG